MLVYEIQCDLYRARDIRQSVAILCEFVTDLQNKLPLQKRTVNRGVQFCLERRWVDPRQSQTFAQHVLYDGDLRALLEGKQIENVTRVYAATMHIHVPDQATARVYQELVACADIDERARALMGVSLAIRTGNLDERAILATRALMEKMPAEVYQATLERVLERFFKRDVAMEAHAAAIRAIYLFERQQLLWEQYFGQLNSLALSGQVDRFVALLSFWFQDAQKQFAEQQYLLQSFFLQLPYCLRDMRRARGYKRVHSQLQRAAGKHRWYSLVQDLLKLEKKGISRLLSRS